MVGHLYKTHLENRSSTSLILCDTTKTRACDISGAGSLLALGSAKPNMGECFFADTHTTYYGKALAVIRTGNECGKIHIKASAPNLEDQFIELEVRE